MTRRGITEYIEAIRERYVNADKKRKGRMLDEAEQVTGYHRKVLVRLLGGRQLARTYATLNPVRLRSRIEQTLTRLWELADSPNSKFPCPAIHGNILNDATISVR